MSHHPRRTGGILLAAFLFLSGVASGAHADPGAARDSHIVRIDAGPAEQRLVQVYSAAMGRIVHLTVLRAADPGRRGAFVARKMAEESAVVMGVAIELGARVTKTLGIDLVSMQMGRSFSLEQAARMRPG